MERKDIQRVHSRRVALLLGRHVQVYEEGVMYHDVTSTVVAAEYIWGQQQLHKFGDLGIYLWIIVLGVRVFWLQFSVEQIEA